MSNTDSQRLDAMRRQRDGYRNELRKTEQQVQRVRAFLEYRKANSVVARDGLRALDDDARRHFAVAEPEVLANSKQNQNLEFAQPEVNSFNPRELNRRGWTCGCEPGNYDSCDECQSACNELANFLNRPEVKP